MRVYFVDDRLSCPGHQWVYLIKWHKGQVEQAEHCHWTQHYRKNAKFPISVKSLQIKYPRLPAQLKEYVV